MEQPTSLPFLSGLTCAKVKFVIHATEKLWLPAYKGSTFRGAFGKMFHHILCIQPQTNCETCLIRQNCVYYYIFETPNPHTLPALDSPKVPHPFVLEPPQGTATQFEAGAELAFNLVLIGRAVEYLPYFIFTFDEIGRNGGIGKFRSAGLGRFRLTAVYDLVNPNRLLYNGDTKSMTGTPLLLNQSILAASNPVPPGKLQLKFLTPTRIKHQREYLLFGNQAQLTFQLLIENLYRRIFCLTFFHCTMDKSAFALPETNGVRVVHSNLHWQDWERFSNRQQQRLRLGGFVGEISYEGDWQPWLPLLQAGEQLHLGKATAFGLGHYQFT